MEYKALPFIDPEQVFALVAEMPGAIYLDSSMGHEHYGRYSFILLNPLAEYYGSASNLTVDLQRFKDLFKLNQTIYDQKLPPFTAGLAGYLSYDLSKQLEQIPETRSRCGADYYLGLYNQVLAFDNKTQTCYVMVSKVHGYELNYSAQLNNLITIYHTAAKMPLTVVTPLPQLNLKSNFTLEEYKQCVESAREYILAGDIFEVNLSQCFSCDVANDYPYALLYRKLRQINPAPFAAYLNLGALKILSASPERFVAIRQNQIEARPIKGTSKRNSDPILDQALAKQLSSSTKDRAENIMIVDLMRNDLAKICDPRSIKVRQLCKVESFTNVHHLVSVISGELNTANSIFDIIPACFPGGSITGAPKIRAMQIIEELENVQRGIYCGSIGYFSFNGNVDLSIAIRTLVSQANKLSYHVGGAITLDSNPTDEYNETLVKGQKLLEALNS